MDREAKNLRLVKVDSKNFSALIDLEVNESQELFVADNCFSIAEAYAVTADGKYAQPCGIYDGEVPVGILMIGSDDVEYQRMVQFDEVFKKYTPRVHVITCMDFNGDARDCVFSVKVNKYIASLMYAVPFQFVAAQGAADIDIDTGIDPFTDKLAHL